jgi:hypothetical protein
MQLLQVQLQRDHLLAHRAQLLLLALGGVARRAQVRGLEVGQRVRPVGAGELAQQILAHARRLLGHHGLQPVLHGGGGLVPEQTRELARQHPGLGPEHLVDLRAEELRDHARLVGERRLDLARDLLELVARTPRPAPPARAPARRAPTSIASLTTRRVLAGLQPRAHESAAAGSSTMRLSRARAHEHVDPLLA